MAALEQRSDYTYKFNTDAGRHGWLRLTPAYSVRIVDEIISRCPAGSLILDPFCGVGTTALCAADRGHDATTIDVNPFLVWLARAKTGHYGADTIRSAKRAGRLILEDGPHVQPEPSPPIHNMRRWWSCDAEMFIRRLKTGIMRTGGGVSDLLYVAFCRTLIQLSCADFGHQSMSFKDAPNSVQSSAGMRDVFLRNLDFVIAGAGRPVYGKVSVMLGDSREFSDAASMFDVIITSPPYANRMSYIRELRPFMYWLGHLSSGRDAGEMDWRTIGGTWGIATSRLAGWTGGRSWIPEYVGKILRSIAGNDRSGKVLSNYVGKYCDDMSRHFESVRRVLRPGARAHYIIGNSTFYGTVVPTERIYADMMSHYGFCDVTTTAIRKRNSKKELKGNSSDFGSDL